MRVAIALLCIAACNRTEPITSCKADLAGVYVVDGSGEKWHLLDYRRTGGAIEAYPLFDDTKQVIAGIEIAPRAIDVRGVELAGEVTRRYMTGSKRCDAKAPARVTSCKDNTLEIVLGDPVPPIAFDPCAWGQSAPTRRERWRR